MNIVERAPPTISTGAKERIVQAFRARTPRSAALHARALDLLPGGVNRNIVHHDPHPVFVQSGQGAWLLDEDGNRYLSYDELARSSQALGALNALPLELQAMQTNATTPVIYALGALTTALSLVVIGLSLTALWWLGARQAGRASDAGKGMV